MEYLIDTDGRSEQSLIKRLLQRRYMAAVLGLVVTFMLTALRINLGIAIVAMVYGTALHMPKNESNRTTDCPAHELYNSTASPPPRGEFQWSPELQGYIQGAGYVGAIIFQIPGGIFARKYGAKKVIIYAHLVAALSNLLSPVAARSHPYLLLSLALVRGFAQAVLPPALAVLTAKWFSRTERGFLGAIIYSGQSVGALLTGVICGILCDLEFLDGWPLVFYTFGLVSFFVSVFFYFLYYETPEEDPWITESELDYIQKHQDIRIHNTDLPIPWSKMLASPRTHILVLAIFGNLWMYFYFVSEHPTYLGTILHIPIKENGLQSNLPFLVATLVGWIMCYVSYRITSHRLVGVNTLRKGINSLSCVIFVIGMVGIYFAKCNILLNNVFLYLATSSNGLIIGGALITAPDMSPTFCGPLMGYASSMASFSGVVATVMVGLLTNDAENLTQWGKIFLISAGVSLTTGLLYQLFGSAEVQPWDPAFKELSKEKPSEENEEVPS